MGALILKLKCHFCGFKSVPRGDRCRRCNKQIPEAQKKPMSKELFRLGSGVEKSSASINLVKESTLTKLLKKKQELVKKREEALRRKQQEAEKLLEIQSQQELQKQIEFQAQKGVRKDISDVSNELNSTIISVEYDPSQYLGYIPDIFPPIELTDVEVTRRVTAMEPAVDEYDGYQKSLCLWRNRDEDLEDLIEGTLTGYFTLIPCQSVRIGSYKVIPEEKVILSTVGIWMCIPTIMDAKQKITLTIDIFEIVKVLAFYTKPATLFVYVVPSAVKRIQKLLDMDRLDGPFFDPLSPDETERRITLLCMPLHADMIRSIRDIFGRLKLLQEINADESNDLLVRSSPKYAPFHSDMISLFV